MTRNTTCTGSGRRTNGKITCWRQPSFLEFGLDKNNKFDAHNLTDKELLIRVHHGRGGKSYGGQNHVLKVVEIFGGTYPPTNAIHQDFYNGLNNLESAKAVTETFFT